MTSLRRLGIAQATTLCLLANALPVLAEGSQSPPPEFFMGLYRMVGVDASGPVDKPLRLDPAPQGLAVSTCDLPDAGLLVLPGPLSADRYIDGSIEGRRLTCDHFITWGNYGLLACYGEDDSQTRLTLWPEEAAEAALPCEN
jgi:hypothetical protein